MIVVGILKKGAKGLVNFYKAFALGLISRCSKKFYPAIEQKIERLSR